jgi:hypothetical protein
VSSTTLLIRASLSIIYQGYLDGIVNEIMEIQLLTVVLSDGRLGAIVVSTTSVMYLISVRVRVRG